MQGFAPRVSGEFTEFAKHPPEIQKSRVRVLKTVSARPKLVEHQNAETGQKQKPVSNQQEQNGLLKPNRGHP